MDELNLDWKDIVKQVVTGVLDELKDGFVDLYKTEILPSTKEAKEEFFKKLEDEASSTSSVWVKIRNALIKVIVNVLGTVVVKVLDKFMTEVDKENV